MMRTIDLFFSFLIWHSSPQIFANSSAISPSFWDALDYFYILCVYFIQASDYSKSCFVIFKHWQNCFYPFYTCLHFFWIWSSSSWILKLTEIADVFLSHNSFHFQGEYFKTEKFLPVSSFFWFSTCLSLFLLVFLSLF